MSKDAIGGLQAVRKLLMSKVINKSPSKEQAAYILPGSTKAVYVPGRVGQVDLTDDAKFREWYLQQMELGNRDKNLPLWGSVHTHPNTVENKVYNWYDNGPSAGDLVTVSKYPKGADHQLLHPVDMVQEFYNVPSRRELQNFADSIRGPSNTSLLDLINPNVYSYEAQGVSLPDGFDRVDPVGAINRALQDRLKRRGLITLENTGSDADNDRISEVAEQLKKIIPFKEGGLAQLKACRHG